MSKINVKTHEKRIEIKILECLFLPFSLAFFGPLSGKEEVAVI